MKRRMYALLLLFPLLILSSCKKNYYNPDETEDIERSDYEYIQLSATDLSLELGDYVKLGAVLSPQSDKTISFSSSDSKVAAVDNSGNISAVSAGKAIITAQTEDGIKANCQVEVNGIRYMTVTEEVPATAKGGESFTISVKFENCTYPTVKVIPNCKSGTITSANDTINFDGSEKQIFTVGDTEINFVVDGTKEINSIMIVGFDKGEMIDAREITIYPPLPDYEALKKRITSLEGKVADLEDKLKALPALEEKVTDLENQLDALND